MQESRIGEQMLFEKGKFIYLKEGPILEVVYADEEKAVCIKMRGNEEKAAYDGISKVISNRSEDYKDLSWIRIGNRPKEIVGRYRWSPIRESHEYKFS